MTRSESSIGWFAWGGAAANRTAEAEALAWQSAIRARMNRMGEAVETADAALSVADEATDRRVRALAHRSVAHMRLVSGNLESGLAEARVEHNWRERHAQQMCSGRVCMTWPSPRRGAATTRAPKNLAEEALRLADEDHNVALLTSVCFCLGVVQTESGQYLAARQALQLGLDTAAAAGERRNVAKLMNTLGALYEELFDFEMADRVESASHSSRAADGSDVSVHEAERYSLLNLATTALHRDDIEGAHATWTSSRRSSIPPVFAVPLFESLSTGTRGGVPGHRRQGADTTLGRRGAALAMSKGVQKNVAKS